MDFSMRTTAEIKKDIDSAAAYYGNHTFQSCFLQDGDSFIIETGTLIEILTYLKKKFPNLQRISSYGRAQTMVKKSNQEIKEICNAGLNTLYCGMESGSDKILKRIRKGTTRKNIIKSAQTAKQAGMQMSHFVISGLGGRELWKEHALDTASALNEINPHKIRVLTIGVKQGSGLEKQMLQKKFSLQSEKEIIEEQRLLIQNLKEINSHYANHHEVDLILDARGQLPKDKAKLLAIIDRFLSLSDDDQINFTFGRRLGYYKSLNDMTDENRYNFVEAEVQKVKTLYPDQLEVIFHQLRAKIV